MWNAPGGDYVVWRNQLEFVLQFTWHNISPRAVCRNFAKRGGGGGGELAHLQAVSGGTLEDNVKKLVWSF